MPEIFQKNCKLTVIEYGAHAPEFTMQQIKDQISAFIQRIAQKKKAV